MIELQDVLNIHNILIDKFGGSKGVRDQGSLESAINRPFATFEKHDL
jgi:death on curing protein